MNEKFLPLFETYMFNNGVTTNNRLAIAPLTHWSADSGGHATPPVPASLVCNWRRNDSKARVWH